MTVNNSSINESTVNSLIPFFPSESWKILNSDIINPATTIVSSGKYFSYIQAFFDPTQLTNGAILAIYSGKTDSNGNHIVNPVRFGYSGQRIPIKGVAIFTTGLDINGNTITSTEIGSTVTTQIQDVYVYGGTQ